VGGESTKGGLMARWNPTKIRWVNDTLESSTGASRVETDQRPAYAKLLGNPEGPQALFCEWVGTRAAEETKRRIEYVLREHDARLVREDRIDAFVDEVRREAHH
jgi:hypothetical protein